jgi:uncharacterized damage-inducible protein DinB
MFTKIEHFKGAWAYESEGTSKILQALSDKSLSQKVTDDHRNLGRMAWHLVVTIPEMCGRMGLKIDGPGEHEPIPSSAAAIKKAYDTAAKSLLEQILATWKDDTLLIEDDMYGEKWKRGASLSALISHQIHHRGQMTVLMRQAGLPVPGVYGPSLEEWPNYGANPPAI